MRIAYLIPQFPGQTHIFFWREIQALRKMGLIVDVVSTRKPPQNIVCHTWSEKAMSQTQYLTPVNLLAFFEGIWMVLKAGPFRLYQCIKVVKQSPKISIKMRLKMLMLIPVAGCLIQLARKNRWQHYHAHSCAHSALLLLYVRLLSDLSYSLTLHGPLSMYGPAQRDKWLHADFGITVTEKLRNEVLESLPEVREESIFVAPMGVNLDVFIRRTEYVPPMPPGPFKIITCGRLHFGKGHQDLIRAIAELNEDKMDVYLKIMGEGSEYSALERLINDLDLIDRVVLMGAVAEETVRDELEQAHVFALASHDEAIGVAIMEAMAMSLPVVVTDVGGVNELVRDGREGLLVKPHSPSDMAKAIGDLLMDSKRCCRLGKLGAKRVTQRFSSERSAELIYGQLVSRMH